MRRGGEKERRRGEEEKRRRGEEEERRIEGEEADALHAHLEEAALPGLYVLHGELPLQAGLYTLYKFMFFVCSF